MSDRSREMLTAAQRATMREMNSYPVGRYWFRQATCLSLVELGLAVRIKPELKRSPHALTALGRAALTQEPKP